MLVRTVCLAPALTQHPPSPGLPINLVPPLPSPPPRSSLSQVPIAVMNAMDQVPAAQLKKLLEDEEVLQGLPLNLRQQVGRWRGGRGAEHAGAWGCGGMTLVCRSESGVGLGGRGRGRGVWGGSTIVCLGT